MGPSADEEMGVQRVRAVGVGSQSSSLKALWPLVRLRLQTPAASRQTFTSGAHVGRAGWAHAYPATHREARQAHLACFTFGSS